MNRNINGYQVTFNKSFDRHTCEGIVVATRPRADGTLEVLKSCVDDNINSFVAMLKGKK